MTRRAVLYFNMMKPHIGKVLKGFALCAVVLVCVTAESSQKLMVRQDRWYSQPYGETWKTVMRVLRRGEWEIIRAENGKGLIQTGFLEFPTGTFGRSVASPPPRLTWEYGFYHKVVIDSGRVRLKISVRPAKGGTRVAVNADLEEFNFHRDLRVYLWVSRESNGAIEQFFLRRVQELLENPGEEKSDALAEIGGSE